MQIRTVIETKIRYTITYIEQLWINEKGEEEWRAIDIIYRQKK